MTWTFIYVVSHKNHLLILEMQCFLFSNVGTTKKGFGVPGSANQEYDFKFHFNLYRSQPSAIDFL